MKILAPFLFLTALVFGQTQPQIVLKNFDATPAPTAAAPADDSTSNDLFMMIGSDFDRPGLLPRANYNIGYGHTIGALTKYFVGDEVTFSYTYENGGPHGFWHSSPGSSTSTESLGLMKNFNIPGVKSQRVTLYTWPQIGITTIAGHPTENRLYGGFALGSIVHLPHNTSIWIQEAYNKVVTVPWYTTTSIGYTLSWK